MHMHMWKRLVSGQKIRSLLLAALALLVGFSIAAGAEPSPAHVPIPHEIRPSFFLPPAEPSPTAFSQAEAAELRRRYGIHTAQNPVNQAVTLATDTLGWRDRQALELINRHAAAIHSAARTEALNPLVLAAILFDEIRHEKPTEEVMTRWGLAQTLGLAQLSLRELVMQGYFDPDLQSLLATGQLDAPLRALQAEGWLSSRRDLRRMPVSELRIHLLPPQILELLPKAVIARGQRDLLRPDFNIQVLARQLSRVRQQQGLPPTQRFEHLQDFQTLHQLARVVVFHNGRLDYAAKIISYLRLPLLEIALNGCLPPALPPYSESVGAADLASDPFSLLR